MSAYLSLYLNLRPNQIFLDRTDLSRSTIWTPSSSLVLAMVLQLFYRTVTWKEFTLKCTPKRAKTKRV